jgi:hypothetical protein
MLPESNLVDQSPGERRLRVDSTARKSEPGGSLPADSARQADRPARAGNQSQCDLGQLKKGIFRRHDMVRESRKLDTRAETRAVDLDSDATR